MKTNETIEWYGFTIQRKQDFGPGREQEGYIVTRDGCNIMPGATWFKSVEDAQKGIAAYRIALRIAPEARDGYTTCNGDMFWCLMELTK